MQPKNNGYTVQAICSFCKVPVTFDWREEGREIGYSIQAGQHQFAGQTFNRIHYRLLRCSGCGRCAVGYFHDRNEASSALIEALWPSLSVIGAALPANVPKEIVAEFREGEVCAAAAAFRGGSALIRSALEKTLKLNGYTQGNLLNKIDLAASDGVITDSQRRRAHAEIRDLGNDVLHDEWRAVTLAEFESARHYCQRILEAFYDLREAVEETLRTKNRLPASAKTPSNGT